MKTSNLLADSLRHYWRTNAAVVIGVAISVSVLSGALLVGDSVRNSLRDLLLRRLGNTSIVLSATHYFPEDLGTRLASQPEFQRTFGASCPLIRTRGAVVNQDTRERASNVQVYGVDDRFWQFHRQTRGTALTGRSAWVSENLAKEAAIQVGSSILLRLEASSDIPIETLHGRKEGSGRTVRLTARRILPPDSLGEFSLLAEQGPVNAVFVSLERLQRELERTSQVNMLLIADGSDLHLSTPAESNQQRLLTSLKQAITLEDMAMKIRPLDSCWNERGAPRCLSLVPNSTLLDGGLLSLVTEAAEQTGLHPTPVLTYLANQIRSGVRQVPYSLVTALPAGILAKVPEQRPAGQDLERTSSLPPIWLNDWAARDLEVGRNAKVSLDYYVWREEGRLETRTADFRLESILDMTGPAADRNLAPAYPGISDSDTLSDWDPPFPMDLGLIRPLDEEYWKRYRTTPKAFVSLNVGQELWSSRFGNITSIRLDSGQGKDPAFARKAEEFQRELLSRLNPVEMGFSILPVKAQGLSASRGATDFGAYFTYFSFFLVASAILLATLFFRLGVEQRFREIGLLKALGFAPRQIRALFLKEAVLLATGGSLLGSLGALAYGLGMMHGLRHWWVGAVNTTQLSLHLSYVSLIGGAVACVLTAMVCVFWTLRHLVGISPRALLSGQALQTATRIAGGVSEKSRRRFLGLRDLRPALVGVLALLGLLLVVAAAVQRIDQTGGFFGAGLLFLTSLLILQSIALARRMPALVQGHGLRGILLLGLRSATYRPGRSLLCIALIASATFIIVAVESFRRDSGALPFDRQSGTGGFTLLAESLLPVLYDFEDSEGRQSLNLQANSDLWSQTHIQRFRLLPGEDTSCLNLFQPKSPRVLAPTPGFLEESRFSFQQSIPGSALETKNPWLLLRRQFADGAIPVIGDSNSLTYVLHLKVGGDWVLNREGLTPIRLRVVASLSDSLFQSELLMSEENFKRLFPQRQGYQIFLIEAPLKKASEITQLLEDRLANYGLDVVSARDQLAAFHRVENTYLSTFQTLGAFGLLLGTLGLGAVLLRNVLERRQELALLQAVGYSRRSLVLMILSEHTFLLVAGLAMGSACAFLAILPVLSARGWSLPAVSVGSLLLTVLLVGLVASFFATRIALRARLLEALRTE